MRTRNQRGAAIFSDKSVNRYLTKDGKHVYTTEVDKGNLDFIRSRVHGLFRKSRKEHFGAFIPSSEADYEEAVSEREEPEPELESDALLDALAADPRLSGESEDLERDWDERTMSDDDE